MSQQASPIHHAHPSDAATQDGARSVPTVGVPLALLRDKRLTPMERNLYLVFLAAAREGSLPPNLEWQRRLLACAETQSLVSPSTAKRCVFLLRLTRWIHQEPQRHDPITGQPLPPAYVVHDTPASCATVCAADPGYADLLRDALCDTYPATQAVATSVLVELAADPTVPAVLRPLVVQVRLPSQGSSRDDERDPPAPPSSSVPTASDETPPRSQDVDPTFPSASLRAAPLRTYKETSKEVRTHRAGAREGTADAVASAWPSCLQRITQDQHRDLRLALHRLPDEQRQEVLAELEARSRLGTVRNAVAYLLSLIARALRGEFRLWAGRRPGATTPVLAQASPAASCVAMPPELSRAHERRTTSADPESVRVHLARIRDLLNLPAKSGHWSHMSNS
ncbi:STY4528 family pathogenicity island replication protein [Burkholderia stagnalis]|uniref:Uncharacterized protein n=1 Tax=Burkholderia stagnalis TaxID=1503054 RepID=A0A6L3MUC4_9BURK|nr:STY4528 family pathogenicity island replication protein [Burkholderia stagnalis]KAB0636145.1 hypothetical protein F7R25_20935 [Burkholderia stagnalis]VWB83761.1 hypothetical protein BST28156_04015 [Burkholderia stagnalis]